MPVKPTHWIPSALALLLWVSALLPAGAQQVYKCGSGNSVAYSDKPCSGRTVSTKQAPVPAIPNPKKVDVHKIEENRVMARSLRRRPGETAAQFDLRRRRARLLAQDRAECARLDTRMPVEAASLNNPDPAEVASAQMALRKSRKRFGELRC